MGLIPRVGLIVDAFLVRARIEIWMGDAGHLEHLGVHTRVAAVPVFVGEEQARAHFHVVAYLVVDVGLAIVAGHLVALHQSAVFHQSQRYGKVGLVVAAVHAHFVVLRCAVPDDEVAPVGVRLVLVDALGRGVVFEGIACQHGLRCHGLCAPCAGLHIVLVVEGIFGLVLHESHLSVAVERVRSGGGGVPRVVDIQRNIRLAGLAALGGDDDDTVGTTRTVDGRGRSVFQNVHRLDVGGVEIERRTIFHAVDQDERVVACEERTGPAQVDVELAARLTRGLREVHARHFGLHGLHGVGGSHVFQVARLDGGNRACEVALLLHGIADDHQFVKVLVVFFHRDVEARLSGHAYFLFAVAHIAHFQCGIVGHVGDGEVAVKVGHAADGSAVHDDAHSDHRFAGGIFHVA